MTRITFENLPSTNTPRTAENLNKLNNLVIKNTEPTTGEEVWIKDSVNLFNGITEDGGVSLTDGTDTTASNWRTQYIKVKPNTTYSWSSNGTRLAVNLAEYDNFKTFIQSTSSSNFTTTGQFTTQSTTEYIRCWRGTSTAVNTWQLEYGTDIHEYQNYIETPTINTNQNGQYKEIYNKDNMGSLTIDSIKGKNLYPYGDDFPIRYVYLFPIKTGETYTMSFKGKATTRSRVLLAIFSDTERSSAALQTAQVYVEATETLNNYNITITANTNGYLFTTTASSLSVYTFANIMVEKNTIVTEYKDFNTTQMGNLIVDSVIGKNLFNKNNVNVLNASFNADQVNTLNSSENARTIYIPCKPNTTYTLSKTLGARFFVGYTKTTPALNVEVFGRVGANNSTKWTITTDSDAKYLVALIYNSSVDTNLTLEQVLATIQVELGSEATSYTPYKSFDATAYIAWGNTDNTNDFAEQNINIGDYSRIDIIFKRYKSQNGRIIQTIYKETTNIQNECIGIYDNKIVMRQAYYTGSVVHFYDAVIYQTYGTATTDNSCMIPLKIIGYK